MGAGSEQSEWRRSSEPTQLALILAKQVQGAWRRFCASFLSLAGGSGVGEGH